MRVPKASTTRSVVDLVADDVAGHGIDPDGTLGRLRIHDLGLPVHLSVAVVLVLGIAVTAWVLTRDGDQSARGVCDNRSYEFALEADDGGLEVSYELQTMAPGEVWTVQIEQDGNVLTEGDWTTDADGEIDLDAFTQPENGDEFTVEASNSAGDVCTATLRG